MATLCAPVKWLAYSELLQKKAGGNTATDQFFDVLSADFDCLDVETLALNEHHRTFPGLHDRWQVLRKK